MGILVWLLGNARAIPRNYHHVVLDDVAYDWVNGNGASYDALVARAVFEAPAHHAFVTEYAGPSSILSGSVAVPVFEAATFARITDLVAYLTALRQAGFAYPFAGPARAALAAAITEPAELVAMGVTPDGFYANLDQWVQSYAATFPTAPPIAFDPVALSTDLDKRAVAPLRQAQQTFAQFPALTRLHTVLSPEDMTEDPVFSENPDLPQFVGSVHSATLSAGSDPILTSSDTGLSIRYPGSLAPANLASLPGSLRIEVLRESGVAIVSQNNAAAIAAQTGLGGPYGGGCRVVAPPAARGQLAILAMLGLLAAGLRRRGGSW